MTVGAFLPVRTPRPEQHRRSRDSRRRGTGRRGAALARRTRPRGRDHRPTRVSPTPGPRCGPVTDLRVRLVRIDLVQRHRADKTVRGVRDSPRCVVSPVPVVASGHELGGRLRTDRPGVPARDVLISDGGQQVRYVRRLKLPEQQPWRLDADEVVSSSKRHRHSVCACAPGGWVACVR